MNAQPAFTVGQASPRSGLARRQVSPLGRLVAASAELRRVPTGTQLDAPASTAYSLPLHCEAQLRALAMALRADEAALLILDSQHQGHGQRIALRAFDPAFTRARQSLAQAVPIDFARETSVWIEPSSNGATRTSHLRAQLWQDDQHRVLVDLVREPGSGSFGAQDLLSLRLLAPGLSLGLRAALSCVPSALAADLLDQLPYGVALLSRDRRILFRNTAMQGILTRGDALVSENGLLCAPDELNQDRLERAVRQFLRGDAPHNELMILAREPSRPAYLAIVEPFDPALCGDPARDHLIRLHVVDPDYTNPRAVAVMARHFALTRMEIEVVEGMLLGLDVAECAAHLKLAVSTARWHLKRVFAKTGTDGRAALILLFVRGLQLHGT